MFATLLPCKLTVLDANITPTTYFYSQLLLKNAVTPNLPTIF